VRGAQGRGTEDLLSDLPDLGSPGDDPVHVRIEHWLAAAITSTRVAEGDRLPPESDLATALGVSRMTLRQALGALESRGLVVRRRGRTGGTFASRPRIECDLTGLPGFTEQMRRAQVKAGARVVRAETVTAPPEVARALDLPRDGLAHLVVRVRLADRQPLALEETYLPAAQFPGLLERRLTGSLYSLMRRSYDLAPQEAVEFLEPVVADDEQAALLGTEPGSALMLVTRTAFTAHGRPVEHAYDRYRADRTRIALRTAIDQGGGATASLATELRGSREARG
jgi:GntR family transcriptional regulator